MYIIRKLSQRRFQGCIPKALNIDHFFAGVGQSQTESSLGPRKTSGIGSFGQGWSQPQIQIFPLQTESTVSFETEFSLGFSFVVAFQEVVFNKFIQLQ